MAVRVTSHGKLDLQFGPHKLRDEQVYYYGKRSLGIVNFMESTPGHLLILPKRPVDSLAALTEEEAADFMLAIQRTSRLLEDRYGEKHSADGVAVVLVERSSSVPHLHAHIAPRLTEDVLAAIERTETILAGPPERQIAPPSATEKAAPSEVQHEADLLVKIADRAERRHESPTKKKHWPRPLPSHSSPPAEGGSQGDQGGATIEFGPRMLLTENCVSANSSAITHVNPTPTVPGHLLIMPKRRSVARLKDLSVSECRDLGVALQKASAMLGAAHRHAEGIVALMIDRAQPLDLYGRNVEPQVVGQVHWSVTPRAVADPFRAVSLLDQNELLLGIAGPTRDVSELKAEAESIRATASRGADKVPRYSPTTRPKVVRSKPNALVKAASDMRAHDSVASSPPPKAKLKKRQAHSGRAMPGTQPINFEVSNQLEVSALRALTPHASADSTAGSPVRQVRHPHRYSAPSEKPEWDSSTRKKLWTCENSLYRHQVQVDPKAAAEEAAFVKLFTITMDKIRAAALRTASDDGTKLDLDKVFREIDLDGNGVLDMEELGLACETFGIRLAPHELEVLFSFFDRDGAGVESGEFSWVFYNRRMLEKGSASWAGQARASGGGSTDQGFQGVMAQLESARAHRKAAAGTQGASGAPAAGSLKDRITARELSAAAALDIIKGVFDKISAVFGEGGGKGVDLKAAFEEFDSDGGGTIDEVEFGQLLINIGVDLSAVELDLVMKHFDKDGSGVIEYAEFAWTYYNRRNLSAFGGPSDKPKAAALPVQAETATAVPEAAEQSPLNKVFDKINELATAKYGLAKDRRQNGESIFGYGNYLDNRLDLQAVFKKNDTDASGSIDRDELAAGLLEMGVQLEPEDIDAVFAVFDRDGGGVEFGEFAQAFYNRRALCKPSPPARCPFEAGGASSPGATDPAAAERARRIARDPTYVVKVKKPVFVKSYDNSPMGIFEQAMDKIRDKATDPSGKKLDLKKIFEEFDEDGGGTIDKQELENGLMSFNARLSQVELDTVFSMFDRDGGGIEYAEFVWCFYNRRTLSSGNAAWANDAADGAGKKVKPLVGDARFRHWYEKEMVAEADKRKKAEKLEREHKLLRQEADRQRMMRKKQGFQTGSKEEQAKRSSPTKPEWVPSAKSLSATRVVGSPYDDKYLTYVPSLVD